MMKRGICIIAVTLCLAFMPLSAFADNSLSISGMELGFPGEKGYYPVEQVFPASPADRAGIREGDQLVEVDHVNISGLDPSEVENILARRAGSGRSSVITLKRNGANVLSWLKPHVLSVSQEKVLDLYQKVEVLAGQSDSVWQSLNDNFREWTSSGKDEKKLKEAMDLAGQEFLRLKLRISSLELPSETTVQIRSICSDLRHAYAVLQNARNDARWKMTDYAIARWNSQTNLQNRWDRMVSAIEQAERQDRKAEFLGMKLLRSVETPGEDLAELMGK